MKTKIWKDTVHGFKAKTNNKVIAWASIRNRCHKLKIEVPTMDEIVEV